MTTVLKSDDLLDSAYRVVRRLTPPEAPYPGLLARDGDDAVVLVDPSLLPQVSRRRSRGAHVLEPVDVARVGNEPRLVLPWCVDSLPRMLAWRRAEGIEDGEAVTIAISLYRGFAALQPERDDVEACGSWWVTDTGRPVFALGGDDARPIGESTREAWSALAAATTGVQVRACLQRNSIDDLATPAALFAVADPMPVTMMTASPRRISSSPSRRNQDPVDEAERTGLFATVLGRAVGRFVDPEWGTRAAGALHAVSRRIQGPRSKSAVATSSAADSLPAKRGRHRAVLLGGLVASTVLAVGLLWPSDTPNAEADAASHATPSPTPTPTQSETALSATQPTALPTSSPEEDDPTTELTSLLARAGQCEDLSACPDVFENDGGATLEVKLPIAPASVTLLDDLGGVAVFRVGVVGDAADAGSLVVILVDVDGAWRIRDARTLTTS